MIQNDLTLIDMKVPALTPYATPGEILEGEKAYSGAYDNLTVLTGTMPNKGNQSVTLNCGESYTIPLGYHAGEGKVTANSLASQTSATATAANVASGKTAWVNGSKITGTMASAPTSISSASSNYSALQITGSSYNASTKTVTLTITNRQAATYTNRTITVVLA